MPNGSYEITELYISCHIFYFIFVKNAVDVYRMIYLSYFETNFFSLWIHFSNFLKQPSKKNLIKYNFKNSRNFDFKRLTITATVTKLLRFTWVMFNVTRMVFLHTASVLPGRSCLKCVYPTLTFPSNFYVCLVMWSGRKLFLLASLVVPWNITPPRVHVVNSSHVWRAANFIFSKKEKKLPPYLFSPWATTARSTPYPNCVPVITEIQKAPRSFRTLTKCTLYTYTHTLYNIMHVRCTYICMFMYYYVRTHNNNNQKLFVVLIIIIRYYYFRPSWLA